ncbi:MAG TPA: hypothetical protein VF789_12100 [Thermoanaerobaculia bacterium]
MAEKKKAGKSSKSARKAQSPAKKSPATKKRSARSALATATSASKPVDERIQAMTEAPLAVCAEDESLQKMLNVLRNREEPIEVRLAALQSLQAASFAVLAFESCRADYIATLRELVEDPDPELRQRVLGILARENDGFVQKKLLEGLKKPGKALVPPEKALQLLSYDVHSEAYPIAREIVKNPPSSEAKREALRLLSADPAAVPVFEKILRDKDELAELRQLSASALNSLRPEKLQEHAREIVLDKNEYDDIQAVSLTALTTLGDEAEVTGDAELLKRVDALKGEKSTKVKKSARRFLEKYGE